MRLARLCCAVSICLAGCAPVQGTATISNNFQSNPPSTGTVSVYPLDAAKIHATEYAVLEQAFEGDLTQQGFTVVRPFSSIPRYVAFIDYATEIGTDQPWARYLTTIVYDTATNQKVYEEDIESDGQSQDTVRVCKALLKQTAKDWRNGATGVYQVDVLAD